ncbi:protein translocase subunit SecDF [Metamycoplasma equirhinis]|uniref:protein translocase subunit SecDF n=1 Tax=Metamycoplasma equirhinis TaxID=92402 RepID=UPI0035945B5A
MKKAKFISNKFRWFINILVLLGIILSVVFGTAFFLAPKLSQNHSNVAKAHVGLKIEKHKNFDLPNSKNILNLTKKYIENQHGVLSSSQSLNLLSNNLLEISSNEVKTDEDMQKLIISLVKKPYLTVTDELGNPLFYKGSYISRFNPDITLVKSLQDFIKEGPEDYNISLDKDPATTKNKAGARQRIKIKLDSTGWDQFVNMANEYFYKYFINNKNDSNPTVKVYFWLNLHEFIRIAKEKFPEDWKKAGENPVNFAYIGNSAKPDEIKEKDKVIDLKFPSLKYNQINAGGYLISAMNPAALLSPDKSESSFYLLNNNKHGLSDDEIAAIINFSYSKFDFVKQYSYFTINENKNKNKYLIAIAILFSIVALFLIAKYRLIGAISILSLGFFVFVFLSILIAFKITINPVVSLSIVILLLVAFYILNNKLAIFKKEINNGANPNKAVKKMINNGLISGLDSIALMIFATIFAIFIKISYINTIGIITFIASFIILTFAILLNTLLIKNLIKTESFDKNPKILINQNSNLSKLTNKIDLITKSKYFTISFAFLAFITLILFGIFAGVLKSPINGLNIAPELKYNYLTTISVSENLGDGFTIAEINKIAEFIFKIDGINNIEILPMTKDADTTTYVLKVFSKNDLNSLISSAEFNNLISILKTKPLLLSNLNALSIKLNPITFANNIGWLTLIITCTIVTSMIYITIRFSLISALILMLKQLFIIILVAMLSIVSYNQLNEELFGGIVFITIFNIVDSAINSQNIKAEFIKDTTTINYIWEKEKIKEIFLNHTRDIFFRQLFNMILSVVIIILFKLLITDINLSFGLTFGLGLVSLSLINLFIIPNIWMHLYFKKYEIKKRRIENGYWNTEKIEEQVFNGINSFSI